MDINKDILIFDVSNFLDLESKKSLRTSCKNINYLTKNTVFFHIGNIILNYLGWLITDYNEFKNHYKKENAYYIKCIRSKINDFYFHDSRKKKVIQKKLSSINSIKRGVILRIFSKSKDDCINILKKNFSMFRMYKNNNNIISNLAYKIQSKTLRDKSLLVYSLLI